MARIALILSIITTVLALLGGFSWILSEWRRWRANRRTITIITMALCLMGGLGVTSAEAVDRYVRQGATGAANGTNWTDAYTQITTCETAMVRSTQDTCWVADGSYNTVTFNTATSGTNVLTIKKATVASHGTSTGWLDAYGDGQAIVSSTMNFDSGYWTFDGQVRNESDWYDSSAYGFKIQNNSNSANRQVEVRTVTIDNLIMRYTWFEGKTGSFSSGERRYIVDVETDEDDRPADFLFHRNLFTNSNQHLFLRTSERAVVEYNAFDNLGGDGDTNHGNSINCYWHCENAIIRFNQWRNIGQFTGYSGVTQVVAVAERNDGGNGVRPTIWIYGNLTVRSSGADGVFGYGTTSGTSNADCLNCREYNNTIVDGNMQFNNPWGMQHQNGNGNIAQNNLFMDTPNSTNTSTAQSSLGTSGTLSYNAYGTGGSGGGTNVQNNVPTSIFTNFASDDYTLASATDCGVAIGGTAPDGGALNVDMFGNTRGADGCWDRGAFEFDVSGVTLTASPGAVVISGTDATLTAGTAPTDTLALIFASLQVLAPLTGIMWHFRRGIAKTAMLFSRLMYRVTILTRLTTRVTAENLAIHYLAWSNQRKRY